MTLTASQWQIERAESGRIFSSCPVSLLESLFGASAVNALRQQDRLVTDRLPTSLELRAEDLPQLRTRTGYRFSIDSDWEGWDDGAAIRQDLAERRRLHPLNRLPIIWPEFQTSRLRLIGMNVQFSPETGPAMLSVVQEADGWVTTVDGNGRRRRLELKLPSLEDPQGFGVRIGPNSLTGGGLETRPLFGTYVIKIDPTSYTFVNQERFFAKVCLVAVGVPR
jgi:hypothetical protein